MSHSLNADYSHSIPRLHTAVYTLYTLDTEDSCLPFSICVRLFELGKKVRSQRLYVRWSRWVCRLVATTCTRPIRWRRLRHGFCRRRRCCCCRVWCRGRTTRVRFAGDFSTAYYIAHRYWQWISWSNRIPYLTQYYIKKVKKELTICTEWAPKPDF